MNEASLIFVFRKAFHVSILSSSWA